MNPTCPVCDSDLDARHTSIVQSHNGRMYFFRSPICLKVFRKDPERFLAGERQTCPADADADDTVETQGVPAMPESEGA